MIGQAWALRTETSCDLFNFMYLRAKQSDNYTLIMTQEEANNGNRLIEDLMGSTIKIEQEDVKDIPLAFLALEDMKFHESWKWLMPVVIKIEEELGHSVLIQDNLCRVIVDDDTSYEHDGDDKLDAVWRAVVKYLDAEQG